MKTLYLVRHAKSSWADPGMGDFDRPLNERGMKNAPFMAGTFAKRGEPVDLIVSSPANRALTTARFFAAACSMPTDRFIQDPRIYHADHISLLHIVNALPNAMDRVMLFGHNPGFTMLAEYISDTAIGNMPTCSIVRIDLLVDDWAAAARGTGTLMWFDQPKNHHGQD